MSSTSGGSLNHPFDLDLWSSAVMHYENKPRDAFWDTVAATKLYQAQSHLAHEGKYRVPMCGEDFLVSPTVLRASILYAVEEIKEVEGSLQDVLNELEHCFNSSRCYKIWTDVGSRSLVDTSVVKSLHAAWGRPLVKGNREDNMIKRRSTVEECGDLPSVLLRAWRNTAVADDSALLWNLTGNPKCMDFSIFRRLLDIHVKGDCLYCFKHVGLCIDRDLTSDFNGEAQDLKQRWIAVVEHLVQTAESTGMFTECITHDFHLSPNYCF